MTKIRTGARGDGDEPGDDPGAEPDGRPLPLQAIIKNAPGEAADSRRQIGIGGGHDSAHVGRQGRAGIEPEPTHPQKDGADDDVGDVMRAVV